MKVNIIASKFVPSKHFLNDVLLTWQIVKLLELWK